MQDGDEKCPRLPFVGQLLIPSPMAGSTLLNGGGEARAPPVTSSRFWVLDRTACRWGANAGHDVVLVIRSVAAFFGLGPMAAGLGW